MYKNNNHTNRRQPVRISSLINTVLTRRNWQQRVKLHQTFDFWEEVVGREIAVQAKPALIRGSVLWVDVCDSVWMQQLHLQKILLLDKINERLTDSKLTDIRFKLDLSLGRPPKPEPAAKPKKTPSKKQAGDFDDLTSSVKNEDVKSALKSLWTKLYPNR